MVLKEEVSNEKGKKRNGWEEVKGDCASKGMNE